MAAQRDAAAKQRLTDRKRVRAGHAALLAFAATPCGVDLWLRAPLFHGGTPRALLDACAAVAFWYLAASLARPRWARVALAVVVAFSLVVKLACYRYYHVPFDAQALTSAIEGWADVGPVVKGLLPVALLATALLATAAYGVLAWCHARVGPARRFPATAALVACAAVAGPTGDGGWLTAWHLLSAWRRPSARSRARLADLRSERPTLPSILFILDESVRASDYCSSPAKRCPTAPAVNALLPHRIGLEGMHSVDSYTALSVSALFTGRAQVGPRAPIIATPDLFQLAHAIRDNGRRLHIAYWSSQHRSVFENAATLEAADSVIDIDTLLGRPVEDVDTVVDRAPDHRLVETMTRRLPGLVKPFLLVLHLVDTHVPYYVDASDAPFTPYVHAASWSTTTRLHNAYLDAIHDQDRELARAIRAFIGAQGGAPWIVFFTSDHGEAFGEHHAIHHGQNLYDEQIHVPAWIAWGGGAIDAAQAGNLRAWAHRTTTHLDVLPTLLDALGVFDGLDLAALHLDLQGRSLLRAPRAKLHPVPLTNCTAMFQCPLNTWGVLGETHEIEAQPWDAGWRCLDVATGAVVAFDTPCRVLAHASRRWFPLLPDRRPNH